MIPSVPGGGGADLARGPLMTPQLVIVRDPGAEIHGYAVEADGASVHVVWMVASGRFRSRKADAARVFLPSEAQPWRGLAIRPEALRAHRRAAS
ncbi:hypothetical protein SCMU_29300 [Sinomonas cyclohexanicum]|uniref:Uncharacterized protein n=1 Tax=Sinomonas cyclohexanicum TaxID=322009 RepID=A0ABN6FK36_SINCY|nr:hypothetical protein [Corynebacterium cyclohexanicum]BCT77088.1 hypothetical protein SCMU_29300 [Corynebacterium cyclohexanicum]